MKPLPAQRRTEYFTWAELCMIPRLNGNRKLKLMHHYSKKYNRRKFMIKPVQCRVKLDMLLVTYSDVIVPTFIVAVLNVKNKYITRDSAASLVNFKENEFDEFAQIVESFVGATFSCSICKLLYIWPVFTNCKHSFCYDCITTWTLSDETCPICRQTVESISLDVTTQDIVSFINKSMSQERGLERTRVFIERRTKEIQKTILWLMDTHKIPITLCDKRGQALHLNWLILQRARTGFEAKVPAGTLSKFRCIHNCLKTIHYCLMPIVNEMSISRGTTSSFGYATNRILDVCRRFERPVVFEISVGFLIYLFGVVAEKMSWFQTWEPRDSEHFKAVRRSVARDVAVMHMCLFAMHLDFDNTGNELNRPEDMKVLRRSILSDVIVDAFTQEREEQYKCIMPLSGVPTEGDLLAHNVEDFLQRMQGNMHIMKVLMHEVEINSK